MLCGLEPSEQIRRLRGIPARAGHEQTEGALMIETSMRGTRLGALSLERDDNVPAAERILVTYICPNNHETVIPMSTEADEIPHEWDCRCGAVGERPNETAPEKPEERYVRTHWDMLLERRSLKELAELYDERVALLHEARGELSLKRSA